MTLKWIGGLLVIISCGGFGMFLCAAHKREEWLLRQLISALDFMQCELQYRLTPLPDLCRQAGIQGSGLIKDVFLCLAQELECHLSQDVSYCMDSVMSSLGPFPRKSADNLRILGNSLGRFDMEGQMKGLEALRQHCREDLQELTDNKAQRLRNYQTLGLCAGAALVILFI